MLIIIIIIIIASNSSGKLNDRTNWMVFKPPQPAGRSCRSAAGREHSARGTPRLDAGLQTAFLFCLCYFFTYFFCRLAFVTFLFSGLLAACLAGCVAGWPCSLACDLAICRRQCCFPCRTCVACTVCTVHISCSCARCLLWLLCRLCQHQPPLLSLPPAPRYLHILLCPHCMPIPHCLLCNPLLSTCLHCLHCMHIRPAGPRAAVVGMPSLASGRDAHASASAQGRPRSEG